MGLVLVASTAIAQQEDVIDRIAAVVDTSIILESDLRAQEQFLALNNRIDPNTPGLRDQVLQTMINERLFIAKAVEDSVVVTDEEVQQQLDAAIQQRVMQFGSEAKLEEMYKMPISRIRREYRDEMRKSLLSQRLQQQRFGSASIGRFEVEQFFNTYHDSLPPVPDEVQISRIVVTPHANEKTKAEARLRAQLILDSLHAGADFVALAKRYSEDPGTTAQGGDLGLVRRGQFVKEFESAVFSLSDGEISRIVETQFGYHIIQLIARLGDAVHARHILIRIPKTHEGDSTAIALLDSLKTVALANHNFADLAKQFSEDKETNLIGGSLGTVDLDQLDKSWSADVSPLKDGEISKPFRVAVGNSYGYQIILMKKRITAHTMSLDTDYPKIETLALNYKRNADYLKWIEELRKSIYWKISN